MSGKLYVMKQGAGSKNYLPKYPAGEYTRDGITYVVDDNGVFTLNGTTTLDSGTTTTRDITLMPAGSELPAGDYYMSGCPAGGDVYKYQLYMRITRSDGTLAYVRDIGSGAAFTLYEGDTLLVSLRYGNEIGTVTDLEFRPQIVMVGKNKLAQRSFGSLTSGGVTYVQNDDGSISVNGTASAASFCALSFTGDMASALFYYASSVMTVSGGRDGVQIACGGWTSAGTQVSFGISKDGVSSTFSCDGEAARIYLYVPAGVSVDTVIYPQLELGDTATEYEPYGMAARVTAEAKKLYLVDADALTQKVQRAYVVDTNGLTQLVYRNSISITDAVVTLGTNLTYNASSQTQTVASVVVEGVTLTEGVDYTVSGNTGSNAGNYTLTITGIGNYEGSISSSWNIAKLSLTKPTVSGSFTYDGNAKTCTVSNMNSTYITQSGTTSATNAGTYTVTFTLKSTANTRWADSTTAAISRTWTIGKATGSIAVDPSSLSIVGGAGSTASATITYIGDGEISVASNATDIITVAKTEDTIVCTSVSTGSAIVTITMAEGANYTGASCTIEVQSRIVSFSPEKYTGTVKEMGLVTVDGEEHYLYRLTTNGVLTLDGEVQCWLCGGGARGGYGFVNPDAGPITSGYGGGGGYFTQGNLPQGSYLIVIGEGAKTADSEVLDETITSIMNIDNKEQIYYANGGDGADGGSGGGGSVGYWDSEIDYTFSDYWDTNPIFFSAGKGVNTSTYPFNIESIPGMEDDWGPHCAGGAGGRLLNSSGQSTKYGYGSNGGSDGSDGYMPAIAGEWAQGGNKGGGRVGSSATFYGGGGGGETARPNYSYGDNGYGYQGVVYILD